MIVSANFGRCSDHNFHCPQLIQNVSYTIEWKSKTELQLPTIEGGLFTPSLVSMVKLSNVYMLNIRYINYRLEMGNDGGIYSSWNSQDLQTLVTRNFMAIADSNDFSILDTPREIEFQTSNMNENKSDRRLEDFDRA